MGTIAIITNLNIIDFDLVIIYLDIIVIDLDIIAIGLDNVTIDLDIINITINYSNLTVNRTRVILSYTWEEAVHPQVLNIQPKIVVILLFPFIDSETITDSIIRIADLEIIRIELIID